MYSTKLPVGARDQGSGLYAELLFHRKSGRVFFYTASGKMLDMSPK